MEKGKKIKGFSVFFASRTPSQDFTFCVSNHLFQRPPRVGQALPHHLSCSQFPHGEEILGNLTPSPAVRFRCEETAKKLTFICSLGTLRGQSRCAWCQGSLSGTGAGTVRIRSALYTGQGSPKSALKKSG